MNPKVLEINKAVETALGKFNLRDLDDDSRGLIVANFRLKMERENTAKTGSQYDSDFNYQDR